MKFDDQFSKVSDYYARYRPRYPASLFEYLASVAPTKNVAHDCGTGSGQAAFGLAQHFQLVVATDGSISQIATATKHPRIIYSHERAEDTRLREGSVDLLTVGQALHWFDLNPFYAKAKAVLKRNGVIACWCYEAFECDPEIERLHEKFKHEIVGSFWSPKVKLVDEHYRSVPFPFAEFTAPPFVLEARWDLNDLFGYYQSWSSTQQYRIRNGREPIEEIRPEMTAAWGNSAAFKTFRWPLHIRIGRAN